MLEGYTGHLSEFEWKMRKDKEILRALGISDWRNFFMMNGRELLSLEEIAQRIKPTFGNISSEETKQKANELSNKFIGSYHLRELTDVKGNKRYKLFYIHSPF
ncbi:hypothetical protein J4406_01530 [Candidatus Woesearchaeota archaeon]|nr:hypothetical protein [Candidatus Woesearchaeota archaeon]